MVCTLKIDASLLNDTYGYKYVVYSPKMVDEDDCFEYLHSFDGKYEQDHNRCLMVNVSDLGSKCLHTFQIFSKCSIMLFMQEVSIISMISLCILK